VLTKVALGALMTPRFYFPACGPLTIVIPTVVDGVAVAARSEEIS